jgi:hypothetical protein
MENYEVSDLGRVRSLDRVIYKKVTRDGLVAKIARKGKIISQSRDTHGYPMLNLCVDGVVKSALVHHLVLFAFVGPKPEGMQCRHGDGIRSNNRLANLCWGTALENAADKRAHGTEIVLRGERHGRATLTDIKVRKIRQMARDGKSYAAIGRWIGVSAQQARKIAIGKAWRHVA